MRLVGRGRSGQGAVLQGGGWSPSRQGQKQCQAHSAAAAGCSKCSRRQSTHMIAQCWAATAAAAAAHLVFAGLGVEALAGAVRRQRRQQLCWCQCVHAAGALHQGSQTLRLLAPQLLSGRRCPAALLGLDGGSTLHPGSFKRFPEARNSNANRSLLSASPGGCLRAATDRDRSHECPGGAGAPQFSTATSPPRLLSWAGRWAPKPCSASSQTLAHRVTLHSVRSSPPPADRMLTLRAGPMRPAGLVRLGSQLHRSSVRASAVHNSPQAALLPPRTRDGGSKGGAAAADCARSLEPGPPLLELTPAPAWPPPRSQGGVCGPAAGRQSRQRQEL